MTEASINLLGRLRAVRQMAGFSVTDMAQWFGAHRGTMSAWLVRGKSPRAERHSLLEEPLWLLEKAITSPSLRHKFPVPLSVGLYERKTYIQGVKADAIKRFSKPRSTTTGF